jgi:hypothetical protein
MASGTEGIATGDGDADVRVAVRDADPFATWRGLQHADRQASGPDAVALEAAEQLDVLDDPRLVLTEAYIGRDRRRQSRSALLARVTWSGRRRLLRLELLLVLALVAMALGAVLLVGSEGPPQRAASTAFVPADATHALGVRPDGPASAPTAAPPTSSAASAASAPTAPAATAPEAAAPAPAPPAPAPPAPAPSAPAVATTDASSASAPGSPEAMGAAALALIDYPWQRIPGYSIVFLPIGDAPSPGFYGNTTFTWGQVGGTSTLYVYPGETVDRLAAITAFEIGHEVDAAYVEPAGGHEAIESILGIHPASWAPQCDCAEQGYLSGWYSAAFSDRWSPGVGAWSSLASPPAGATLTAMEPWLDPRIP